MYLSSYGQQEYQIFFEHGGLGKFGKIITYFHSIIVIIYINIFSVSFLLLSFGFSEFSAMTDKARREAENHQAAFLILFFCFIWHENGNCYFFHSLICIPIPIPISILIGKIANLE